MPNLTNNQHTLPTASLKRFVNSKGDLHVRLTKQDKFVEVKPNNKLFTVNRVWDQRAEAGYGKSIEDNFQNIADEIIASSRILSDAENLVVSEFYTLWHTRTNITEYDSETPSRLNGVKGSRLTEEQKANLESKHAMYIEEDGTIPLRFIRGATMQRAIDMFAPSLSGRIPWKLFEVKTGELIVSDVPGDSFIIPLTPKKYFSLANSKASIGEINMAAMSRADKYYFGRDLTKAFVV